MTQRVVVVEPEEGEGERLYRVLVADGLYPGVELAAAPSAAEADFLALRLAYGLRLPVLLLRPPPYVNPG